jgi:hypothetical protein
LNIITAVGPHAAAATAVVEFKGKNTKIGSEDGQTE